MSKFFKLYRSIAAGRTLFGIGPMSRNCVDATIEIANEKKIPIILIASRRQVECADLGGGYVSTTEDLGKYVREKDKGEWVFLARDHGGPWQGNDEKDLTHEQAMMTAKKSYAADIEAGFDILHIDPSIKTRPLKEIMVDVKDLHQYCNYYAYKAKKVVLFEVGTEEHGGHITKPDQFEKFVREAKSLDGVKFVVGNTGLYVQETQNYGTFDRENTKKMIQICNDNQMYFKAHNTDYVPPEAFELMNEVGIHSLNIAPEYGVAETNLILRGLENEDLQKRFIDMAVNSGKWEKWLHSSSAHRLWESEDAKRRWLANICGHYIFKKFWNSFPQTPRALGMIDNFNSGIRAQLKDRIRWHLRLLGWKKELNTGDDEQRRWTEE
jgi:fructose/tagatose bisphosphate aldolase